MMNKNDKDFDDAKSSVSKGGQSAMNKKTSNKEEFFDYLAYHGVKN